MKKVFFVFIFTLLLLLLGCEEQFSNSSTLEQSYPISSPSEITVPDSVTSVVDGLVSAPEPTASEQLAACEQRAREGAAERLTLPPEVTRFYLFGFVHYATGDDQWPIQTAEKRAILTALLTESALYRCPDEFIELRERCRLENSFECVLFAREGEDTEQITNYSIVADSLGAYICWDGAYYIPSEARSEEISQTILDMAYALQDHINTLAADYSDEIAADHFFSLPIRETDTADAF